MIRSVDDGLVADSLIAYWCGMIDNGSNVVNGLVVNVISGSSKGQCQCCHQFRHCHAFSGREPIACQEPFLLSYSS